MNVIVRPDSYLTLHYRIVLASGPASGSVFSDTFDGRPGTLQLGMGQWAPGMEEALIGRQEGSRFSVTLTPAQAYGDRNPDLVQRFVDASLRGWYSYMYGDPTPANELIKRDNPDMTDEQIAFSRAKMLEYGIVDSGDSEDLGIGAMTDKRIKSFFDLTVQAGLYPTDLDLSKAYTLKFVNKKYGMEIKSK